VKSWKLEAAFMASTVNLRSRRSAAQLHALAGVEREIRAQDSHSRRKYLREFNQAFRNYDSLLDSQQLQNALHAADVVLIGDYHALPVAQRYAASLLEQRALAGDRPVVLGVETIFARDQHILEDREAAHEPHLLEISRNAHAQNSIRRAARIGLPREEQRSAAGRKRAADDVEKRTFPGAVGTDQGMDLALRDPAGHVAQREVAAKVAAYVFDAENFAHRSRNRGGGSRPSGRQIASVTSKTPNTVMRQS